MDQPQIIYDPDVLDELEITGFLGEVVTHVRERVAKRQQEVPVTGLRALNSIQRRPLDLISTIRHDEGLSLIVEIKQQSHTGKQLVTEEPDELARLYESLGARAVAVATDPRYYKGELHHIAYVSEVVNIPVLRQDFVFDGYQIYEARAAGADGVILIAALLGQYRLWDLVSLTQRLRMTAIVQVANEDELGRALQVDPRVIGISNVDWRTLEVDLDKTIRLSRQIPDHIVVVSMGGMRTPEDVLRVAEAGVDAIMVGEAILGMPDPEAAIQELYSLVDTDPTNPWRTVE